jgi:RND family efflux transporter MFP subunit
LLLVGGGFVFAQNSGWLGGDASGSWLAVPDIMKSRPEVRVAKPIVQRGRSADATVVASGYLESRRQAKIGARAPGRIEVVNVEEGSRVKKDEILAVLEHADMDAALAATKATLARAEAAVVEQNILIAQNKREYDRMKNLLKSNHISQTEHDAGLYQYESSVARLESMKADVMLGQARYQESEQLRENMFIRAPFDGTVISKDAEVGESILPGGMGEASGRGSAVTIADLDNLEVDCDVKEDYISRVISNQAAEVAVDAVPGERYHGVVRKVIPMGDRARATIKVKVTITDVDANLFPEMSCTVYFLPNQDELKEEVNENPRMFCPTESIVKIGKDDVVWFVDRESHAQFKVVTIGNARDGRTEILSGLEGNEQVVVKPPQLSPNQAVKISE